MPNAYVSKVKVKATVEEWIETVDALKPAEPPCRGPEWALWTSEDAKDRQRAAELCKKCPGRVAIACRSLAKALDVTWGVWGGLDKSGTTATTYIQVKDRSPDYSRFSSNPGDTVERQCEMCGRSFQGHPRRKVCSDDCAADRNARAVREAARAKAGLPPTWDQPVKRRTVAPTEGTSS